LGRNIAAMAFAAFSMSGYRRAAERLESLGKTGASAPVNREFGAAGAGHRAFVP
jgi:hypothetical protein